jgi:hypothetical protein
VQGSEGGIALGMAGSVGGRPSVFVKIIGFSIQRSLPLHQFIKFFCNQFYVHQELMNLLSKPPLPRT